MIAVCCIIFLLFQAPLFAFCFAVNATINIKGRNPNFSKVKMVRPVVAAGTWLWIAYQVAAISFGQFAQGIF